MHAFWAARTDLSKDLINDSGDRSISTASVLDPNVRDSSAYDGYLHSNVGPLVSDGHESMQY